MIETTLTVMNKKGIHARPASQIVQVASQFTARIHAVHNNDEVNAKSIIGLLTLGMPYKAQVTLKIDGEDENEALAALTDLFNNTFKNLSY